MDDTRHMARALKLAARGMATAHPNPMVGCVIAKDGQVVGEGWHRRTGEPHAEIVALEAAGTGARDSTVYVSLEPCSHHGRTPPCADALVEAGVARVVAAMVDPNPEVSGRGLERLRAAGIEVASGLLEAEARELNRGFVKRMQTGRPWVQLKIAASLDGGTAMQSGESQWITGPSARADVQRFRAAAGAIMTGVGTVIADDPRLTVRDGIDAGRQPLRVVLDSGLRTPLTARMFREPGATRIYYCGAPVREDLEEAGATLVRVAGHRGGVDPAAVLDDLGTLGVNLVMVEAGATLAGSLAADALVDEFVIYQAAQLLGSGTRPMLDTPGWTRLGHRLDLDIIDLRRVGSDIRIIARAAQQQET
ncbi:MAG: bifunctional diaminohydroxyphosphoribosylaminopyrimidine deaminase/5-amino-6-(5-phosphoribosylamino)uracil reductase RibD [Woeseiaceae bacterium]|nr:bifunctional diaminohydroxyphosphoribosylaminopyrimidine deaminase/5-amino-6-(5-phosphoribosylamino)uracil reductase RibD [Woeseiaceae bacterium]